MEEVVRIAGVSDIHGNIGFDFPACDIGVIAGDLVPLLSSAENHKHHQELDWLKRKAKRVLTKWRSQCKYGMVFVPGNHDILFEETETKDEAIKILEDIGIDVIIDPEDQVIINGIRISGYPLTPSIQNRKWAFSYQRTSRYMQLATEVIPHCDILVSHGPPQGLLDEAPNNGMYGCASLMRTMLEIGPKVTFCGHIHEHRGRRMSYYDAFGNKCDIVNVCVVDEHYQIRGMKVQEYDLVINNRMA